jgi:hypothetical protein
MGAYMAVSEFDLVVSACPIGLLSSSSIDCLLGTSDCGEGTSATSESLVWWFELWIEFRFRIWGRLLGYVISICLEFPSGHTYMSTGDSLGSSPPILNITGLPLSLRLDPLDRLGSGG